MQETKFEPIMYLFMRADIPDMNPGKGMAQACHAGNVSTFVLNSPNTKGYDRYLEWAENRKFGTTITLLTDLSNIVKFCEKNSDYNTSGIITDPTYPIRGHYGNMFFESKITCGWSFVWDERWKWLKEVKSMKLHP